MTQHHHHPSGADHAHSGWDWSIRGQELIKAAEVTAPMVDQAIAWIAGRLPHARTVLDVGSGPGVAACTFAQMLPDATVVAADGSPELLDLARERAAGLGL